ncbi:MAG: InlB B-repeat-containing protein, partial [Clostridiales bacterium]|nr:InlB B-repeat-containing protein [Clostridiales bacterium]
TTPAECEIAGVETRECANNPAHTETRAIAALGHAWGDWAITTPAECEIDGVETRVCANDSSHTETRTIAALGHAWGDWAITTPAECEIAGVETRECANNPAHTETRAIAALGHAWGEGSVTIAPTETKYGERSFTCENCGETRTEPIPPTGIIIEYADLSALIAALERADAYLADYKKYTKASNDALNAAVERAITLLEANDIEAMTIDMQGAVDAASTAINDAIQNMKKASLLEQILNAIVSRIQNNRDRISSIVSAYWARINGYMTRTVTFNADGAITTASVYWGRTIAKPADPVKDGYHFDGWRWGSESGDVFNFNTRIMGNTMLYASWIANPATPDKTDTEFLQDIAADVLRNGLDQSNLILSGKTLTLSIDGREFVLSENANNRNISGEIALGDGYYLVFDIKGNGSNMKEFRIIQR